MSILIIIIIMLMMMIITVIARARVCVCVCVQGCWLGYLLLSDFSSYRCRRNCILDIKSISVEASPVFEMCRLPFFKSINDVKNTFKPYLINRTVPVEGSILQPLSFNYVCFFCFSWLKVVSYLYWIAVSVSVLECFVHFPLQPLYVYQPYLYSFFYCLEIPSYTFIWCIISYLQI